MSWENIKKICFGALRIQPEDFYSYRLSDLWLTLKGWDDREMFNLRVQRQMTTIISETVNRSMGGKGVVDYIMRAFPLPHDKNEGIQWTNEKISEAIAKRNQQLLARGFKIRKN